MADFRFGLAHAPLTPFSNGAVDLDRYGEVLDFHLRNGAEALALPMHVGESVSLSDGERKKLLEFAIRHVNGRAPVIVNVSEAGTEIAASLATHACAVGAAALIAGVPYYWSPPQPMLVEHFARVGNAGELPFFVFNAPEEMNRISFSSSSVVSLAGRLPHFAGLIDAGLDWQYMIEVVTVARAAKPDFQFVSGTEYMISAGAIGATGLLSPLASIAPLLISRLFELCQAERYGDARPLQENAATLYRIFRDAGIPGLKSTTRFMGRDCGDPRPPLPTIGEAEARALFDHVMATASMKSEPRGWA